MDKRVITNVAPITGALDIVNAAEAVACEEQATGHPRRLGIVSQSLTGDATLCVMRDCVGFETIDDKQLVPVLFAAVKELAAEVEALKAKKTRKATQPSE